MKSFVAYSTATLGLAAIADIASATKAYLDYVPNGSLFSQEIGHSDNDSSQYPDFATAFEAVGLSWTAAFCADIFPDSAMTNGAAFGDPCCTWSQGDTPDFTVTPFTTDPTSAMVCATSSSTTSSATTSTVASTSASTASSATPDTSTVTASPATTNTSTETTASSTDLRRRWLPCKASCLSRLGVCPHVATSANQSLVILSSMIEVIWNPPNILLCRARRARLALPADRGEQTCQQPSPTSLTFFVQFSSYPLHIRGRSSSAAPIEPYLDLE
ncbi:hypothetical protein PHYPSEUDO_000986 [Phytophthora pseudosyringae]|uniref:Temptin Cys/Cys disulfide domain-containing protein n=1 Tax=Phytophthora pseudosyringae TaxID=221518 RepID=A0A8T1V5W4_9STRA|nr:hypothetical protein PHYPSEUDO_000986 [Phytophthora pseudosyringae]